MSASLSDPSLPLRIVIGLQCLFGLAGLALLFRDRAELVARLAGRAPARLLPPPYPLVWLIAGAGFAIGGGLVLNIIVANICVNWFAPAPEGEVGHLEILVGGATQLGALAGIAHLWFWHLRGYRTPSVTATSRRLETARAIAHGARTFLTVLPVVWLVSLGWHQLLQAVGFPTEAQPLVRFFGQTKDPLAIATVLGVAVFLAPAVEELVFRVGLFRALRGNVARPLALVFPALVFAWMHDSFSMLAPLTVLAIAFAIAFERSGHPLTPITAHALFNLNTLVLLLVGLPA